MKAKSNERRDKRSKGDFVDTDIRSLHWLSTQWRLMSVWYSRYGFYDIVCSDTLTMLMFITLQICVCLKKGIYFGCLNKLSPLYMLIAESKSGKNISKNRRFYYFQQTKRNGMWLALQFTVNSRYNNITCCNILLGQNLLYFHRRTNLTILLYMVFWLLQHENSGPGHLPTA